MDRFFIASELLLAAKELTSSKVESIGDTPPDDEGEHEPVASEREAKE